MQEYWRLDPTGGDYFTPPLQGENRRTGRWETIAVVPDGAGGGLRGHSAALGLDLCWQPPKLRLYDPAARRWLQDPDDLHEAHRAAEARASDAEARADDEAAARRAAEAELAALRRRPGHPPPA